MPLDHDAILIGVDQEITPASVDYRYLLVRAGDSCCAIPASAVRRVVRNLPCHPFPGKRPHFVGFAQFGGDPLAVLDLHALLTGETPHSHHGATVILGRGPRRSRAVIGLAVDESIRVTTIPGHRDGEGPAELVKATVDLGGDRITVLDTSALIHDRNTGTEDRDG